MKNYGPHWFISFISTRPFDKSIWSFFIYSSFCAQPFNKNVWSSFIYCLLCMTIRPKIKVHTDFFFICTRPFDQKLGSSLINLFYLYTTIRPKISVLIDLFFLFAHDHSTFIYSFFSARPFDQKLESTLIYFFICTRPFDQIIGSSFIYYFLSARPFDQKLGSSLIYIFHLHLTIRQKYMTFFLLFVLSLCMTIRPKISVLNNSFFLYTTIWPKLGVILTFKFILFLIAPIFFAVMPLYMARQNTF